MAKGAFEDIKPAFTGGRSTSLLDRAVNNLSDTAHGFFPGLLQIGSTVAHDASTLLSGGGKKGFQLDNLGRDMAKGFMDNSFIPALFTHGPGEALKRASDRPFDALLDATLIFPATRLAATGAARGGHLLNKPEMVNWGTNTLGMMKAAPESASLIRMALDPKVKDYQLGDLPAMIKMESGLEPTREFIPHRGSVMKLGDDVFMRRTKRTMPIGQEHLVADSDLANSTMLKYANESALGNPVGKTLADDPAQLLTSFRAQNESIAKLGDGLSELMKKIPAESRFNPSKRLGRKLVNLERAAVNLDVDQNTIAFEDLRKKVRDEHRALRPEVFGKMTDEELNDVISLGLVQRAMGGIGHLPDAITDYSLEEAARQLVPETLADLSMDDARRAGIFVERADGAKHLDGIGDPYGLNDGRQRTWAEFMHEFDNDLGRKGSPWRIRVASPAQARAMHDVNVKAQDVRARLNDLLDPKAGWLLENEFSVQRADGSRYSLMPKDEEVLASQGLTREQLLDEIVNDQADLYVNDEIQGAKNLAEELGVKNLDSKASVKSYIGDALYNYRLAKARAANFDRHSSYDLHQLQLKQGNVVPVVPPRELGIVEKLRSISNNPHLPHFVEDAASSKAFFEFLDGLRNQGAQNYSEMVRGMLDESGVIKNESRLADWTGGVLPEPSEFPDGAPRPNNFYPMVSEGKIGDGRYIDKTVAGNRGESFVDNKPIDKRTGDPYELFLTGDWKIDSKVILDDFKKNRQLLAGERVFQNLKSLALEITDVDELKALQGHLMTPDELLSGAKTKGNFVVVDRNDFFGTSIRKMVPQLYEAASIAADHGDHVGSAMFRRSAKMLEGMDIGADDYAAGKHLERPETTAMQGAEPVVILPADIYQAAVREVEVGKAAIGGFMKSLTEGWKFMVLHTRFAQWMRNNIIGAHLMAALTGGTTRYAKDMVRLFSDPEYIKMYKMMEADARNADVLQVGSSSMTRKSNIIADNPEDMNAFQRGYDKVQNLAEKGSNFNSRWADNPTRIIRMMQQMEDQLAVLEELGGGKHKLTPEILDNYMNDETLRKELAVRTNTEMVDFSDMSAFEKKYLTQVFPFWSWMKGSTKAGARLWADKPGTVWGSAQVSDVGIEHQQDQQGNLVPEFAKALWDPGEAGGATFNTAGFLPYMTPIDFTLLGMGMVPDVIPGDANSGMSYGQYGSENLISNINPFLGGLIQAATGRNVYFGTPMPNASFGSRFLATQEGLPLVKLAEKLIKNETGPKATSMTSRPMTIANYLGVPVQDPRWGLLNQRAVDELNERYKTPAAQFELDGGY